MPTANAFTPFGQMSQKKSTQNLSADSTNTSNTNTNTSTSATPNNTNTNTNTSTTTPHTMEPIKESSTNSLYLSKEHSFAKNNSTSNTTSITTNTSHAPLEKQRSVKGVDSTSYPSGSAYIGGGSGNESPTMQRNATTLDLETSPDHDEHDKR